MTGWIRNLALALLPLALTPVWFYLIAEGYLNFGGGEKDIILLIPWLVWALLYAILFAIFWARGLPIKRSVAYAAGGAAGFVIVVWLALLFWSMR